MTSRSFGLLQVTIGVNPPNRLDKALARDVPEHAHLSRSRLMKMIAGGAVRLNGVVVSDPSLRVEEGQVLDLQLDEPAELETLAQPIALEIVFEDDDVIVVNKPAGMVVHPAPGTPDGTLVNALLHHCRDTLSGIGGARRPGIVHRIDKETSGLLVVAKSDRAHHGLAEQFAAHTVTRRYLALVHGVPQAGDPRLRGLQGVDLEPGNILRIATQLDRHKTDRQRQAVLWHGGRHAVTRARVLQAYGTPGVLALMECWLETGRTHQIRVHMAYAGHGLVGDPTYGGKRKMGAKVLPADVAQAVMAFPRQALHAASLGFDHPVSGERLEFAADLPADMGDLLVGLAAAPGADPAGPPPTMHLSGVPTRTIA